MSKNTKKSHIGLIIFIIILVLAIAGGAGFYFYQRQQPKKAAEKFLSSMQKMDFNTMESMLQSSDLSALDNADIRNAAYTDFFTAINKKMTYKTQETVSGSRMALLLLPPTLNILTVPVFTKKPLLNFSVRLFPVLMQAISLQKKKLKNSLPLF